MSKLPPCLAAFLLILTAPSFKVFAGEREPELCFGVEWLYSANFFNSHQFNYLTEQGRINDESSRFEYTSNGGIYGFIGLNFLECLNVSLYSGYIGIYSRRNVIPVELRMSYYFDGVHSDGPFVKAGGGCAFQEYIPATNLSYLASAGGGWRIAASSRVCIDFFLTLQTAFDHPSILDPDGSSYIPQESIRKNNAQYLSADFGITLSF